MLHHLVLMTSRRFLVSDFDRAVFVGRMCAIGVRDTPVFNIVYFDKCICDFINLLMFLEVYVNLADVDSHDVKTAAQLNVHDSFGRHACMPPVHVLIRNYL